MRVTQSYILIFFNILKQQNMYIKILKNGFTIKILKLPSQKKKNS